MTPVPPETTASGDAATDPSVAPDDAAAALVAVDDLCIEHVNGFRLLRNVSLSLSPGEVVILTGPSGCGKSTLLNLLAGTIDPAADGWRLSGTLRFMDHAFDLTRETVTVGGVIFQDFALFNELTVAENLAIAADHNDPVSPEVAHAIDHLLTGVPRRVLTGACSGGQKQRVAIARTLLANHPVLFMDEPNSGLDVAASARLGELVRLLSREAGITVVIIAHHLGELLSAADRLLLLDPRTATLRDLPPDGAVVEAELRALDEDLHHAGAAKTLEESVAVDGPPGAPPGHAPGMMRSFRTLVRPRRMRLRWMLRYLNRYVWEHCFAPSGLLFTALGTFIIGFVTTWFIFQYLPFRDLLLPVIHSDTLAGLAFTQERVLAPLVTAVLLVTRSVALVGADIGYRVQSNQIRAMRNLNIPYNLYLTTNILLATAIAAVVLVTLAIGATAWVSMTTWMQIFPQESPHLWRDLYFQRLWPPDAPLMIGVDWIVAKALPSVVGAIMIALWLGYRPKRSPVDINAAIAQSLIWAMSFVLVWQTALILFEFRAVSARLEATF